MSDSYQDVLADLQMRRAELERRRAAMAGELTVLDTAIQVLRQLDSPNVGNGTQVSAIIEFVTRDKRWLTHSEIVRALVPTMTTGFNKQRHSARTQIGQLVQRGELRQVGALIGLPTWDEPQMETTSNISLVSARNGRSANVKAVLEDMQRPMHTKDVVAELLRRGLDADERCIASCLALGPKLVNPRWRKVGPSIFQALESSAHTAVLR